MISILHKTVEINGKKYYDVKTFALLTNRATQTIYRLMTKGNSVRKLKCEHILGKPMIPFEELEQFPFCSSGPWARRNVYTFGDLAKEIEAQNG